jgi:type I restriction enzyme, S subunit
LSTGEGKPLPEGWKWEKLVDITTICGGTTPDTGEPSFWNGNIPWITPTDLGKTLARDIHDSQRRITERGRLSCSLDVLPVGTVVLSSRAPIGYLGITSTLTCINQGCKAFIPNESILAKFLYFALQLHMAEIQELGSGATFKEVSKSKLEQFEIAFPSVNVQRKIIDFIDTELKYVSQARAAAEARMEAIRALPAAYLREVFPDLDGQLPSGWRIVNLGSVSELLPSKSISTTGDKKVQAITTGCLDETIFNPKGIKTAQMKSSDVDECLVNVSEVLIARSNTPELVGRATIYRGEPPNVVASDLTIRLKIKDDTEAGFIARYLSSLFLRGYWREHAGGASGSMKKITRTQIVRLSIPLPIRQEQERIVELLDRQMRAIVQARASAEAEVAAIEALPASILRKAFNGEL